MPLLCLPVRNISRYLPYSNSEREMVIYGNASHTAAKHGMERHAPGGFVMTMTTYYVNSSLTGTFNEEKKTTKNPLLIQKA